MNPINGPIALLVKTNLTLGKRVARKTAFSYLIYFFGGICPILIGLLANSARPPILFVTLMALLYVYMVNLMHMHKQLHLNRYQLKIFPVSNHSVLRFLWLSELINLKALVFVIPILACIGAIISFSQFELMLMYIIYVFLLYAAFCFFLLISNLLLDDFGWLRQPLFFLNLATIIAGLSKGRIVSNYINTDTELGFDSLIPHCAITLIFLIAFYVCAYYLTFLMPVKSPYSSTQQE